MRNIRHDTEERFGTIEFTWKDGGTPAVPFDRIAHSRHGELLMVSIVAETQRVKQLRAVLQADPTGKNMARVQAIAAGVNTTTVDGHEWDSRSPGRLNPSVDGYFCYQAKLGYGLAHTVFITKGQGFLMVVTEGSLWQELNSTRFTTPILREWMPYIETRLRDENRLEHARCFKCQCGILTATTKKLDELIIAGLTSGHIRINKSEPFQAVA